MQSLFRWVFVFVIMTLPHTSFAQLSSPVNPNPLSVGSGARAIGQGSAFIAVADDATAASWNPGGLIQLERPEFSAVGSFLSTQQDFDTGDTSLSLSNEAVSRGNMNYASFAYPFRVFEKNVVVALNYQQVYDFYLNLDYNHMMEDPQQSSRRKIDFKSEGGISALSPAISMRITPRLSLGIAVNFYEDELFGNYAWKQTFKSIERGVYKQDEFVSKYNLDTTFKNFQAINLTTGILWDVWEKEGKRLTLGVVYKTPYTAKVDRIINEKSDGEPSMLYREHFEIDFPMSLGVGLGFRYNDAVSFSTDITWKNWSGFQQEDEHGDKWRPLGYGISSDRKIDDTYTVRCGTEYLIFRQKAIIPVRGGLFYDPRPSLDDPTNVYGFSVGSGVTFKRFSIDGAYQFGWANNVDGEDIGLEGTNFDLNEHTFLASIIVYF